MEMQKSPMQENSYQNYCKKGIIDNNQTINKSSYNDTPLQKSKSGNNNFYKSEEKPKYLGVDISKNDKNKQKNFNKIKN